MAFERSWAAVAPQLFTANGGQFGLVTISDTEGFRVKQSAFLKGTSLPDLPVQVKVVLSPTQLIVGLIDNKIGNPLPLDISAYTVASGASIEAQKQDKNKVPMVDISQAVYEGDPVVALRNVMVDQYGDFWDKENPVPSLTEFIRNGVPQIVTEDTATPANNRPLPVKLAGIQGDVVINATNLNLEVQSDGVYDSVENPVPDNMGMIAHERSISPTDVQQTQRVTAKQGVTDTDTISQDVSLHDKDGDGISSATSGSNRGLHSALLDESANPFTLANPLPIQPSNGSVAADFNAGATGAATQRVSANIARNGTELSYGLGAIDSNSLRVASMIANATGAADFNSGVTGAQTLRVSSNLSDGDSNKITSTTINSKQRLDVNTASEGVPGAAAPFQAVQVGGSDGTNLRTLAVDDLGRLKLAGSNYFHPLVSLRVQAITGNTGGLATSLVIPISSTSSGNLIAIAVTSSLISTVTVTDNLSQVYSTAISGTSGTHTSYIFYKANTASGVTSITISSTISSGLTAIVTEYFGISSSPLDRTSTGTVINTTAFSSGSTAATTSAVELLLGSANGISKNNQTYTAGAGWSSVGTANGFNGGAGQIYLEDQYVVSTGSYAATGSASGNDTIIANIATFIVTNTNLIAINQPKLIKSGPGILRKVIINSVGTGSPVLTVYDNTTRSNSTIIANLSLLNPIGHVDYNLNFTTGLTISVNSTTADFTLVYD